MDVLVTGANRGLGLALARVYATRGDRVFACSRSGASALPDGAVPVELDVADAESIDAAHATVSAQTSGLDVLVNNAGILDARYGAERRDSIQRLGELTFEDTMTVLRVNSVAPVMVAQRFGPLLRAGAKLVNISSNAARSPTRPRAPGTPTARARRR
jgi:NAD(P)-dependent dehydrogenase (short-subunit alcohol dehydrogenase family)